MLKFYCLFHLSIGRTSSCALLEFYQPSVCKANKNGVYFRCLRLQESVKILRSRHTYNGKSVDVSGFKTPMTPQVFNRQSSHVLRPYLNRSASQTAQQPLGCVDPVRFVFPRDVISGKPSIFSQASIIFNGPPPAQPRRTYLLAHQVIRQICTQKDVGIAVSIIIPNYKKKQSF